MKLLLPIISKCNTIVNLAGKELVKLFILTEKDKDPEEHADATWVEGGEGEKGTPKKKRVGLETVQKPNSWIKLLCLWHNKSHRGTSFQSRNKKAH